MDSIHGVLGWLLALRQIGALIRKELVALFKEPANRIILFVPALLQALLYGYVGTYDLHDTPYAVLDGGLPVFLAFGAQELGKRGGGVHGGLLFMLDAGRASRALAMATQASCRWPQAHPDRGRSVWCAVMDY